MFRDFCIRTNNVIEKFMFLLTPMGVVIGLLLGERIAFLQPVNQPLFAVIAFVATLSITFADFTKSMKIKPIIAMLLCNHVFIPFIAWLLMGLVVDRSSGFFMGMMLIFAGPCSTSSLIWAGLSGGNKGLSTAFVVLDTTLCFIFTPLVLSVACGTSVSINVMGLAMNLVKVILVPSLLAMIVSSFFVTKQQLKVASPYIKLVTKVFLILVIIIAVSGMASKLTSLFRLSYVVVMISTLAILVFCFFFGLYFSEKVLKFSPEDSISMSIVLGGKNLGLDMILASQFADPIAIVPSMIAFFFLDVITALVSKFLIARKARLYPEAGEDQV